MGASKRPSVVLLDSFVPVAKALARLLPACGGIEWCGTAADIASWKLLVARTHPDVVLIETKGLGCGEEHLRRILAQVSPASRAIVFVDEDDAAACRSSAVVSKRMAPSEIVQSIVDAAWPDASGLSALAR